MPIDFGQLNYVDQIVWNVNNAIRGGTSGQDLAFDPTVDAGLADSRWAAKAARAGAISQPSTFVKGDDVADVVALRRGVNPHAAGGDWLAIAKTQLGVPYVFGAADPNTAFDCSGFTQWVVKRATGTVLPHSAREQASITGTGIGRNELQPGNLVYFSYGRLGQGVVDHVGLYVGNGKMIVAPTTGENVQIEPVNWSAFVGGGAVQGMGGGVAKDAAGSVSRGGGKQRKTKASPALDPLTVVQLYGDQIPVGMGAFNAATAIDNPAAAVQQLEQAPVAPGSTKSFSGPRSAIEEQLYAGFMKAGRPDLARMVGTSAFTTWINAESGWNPGATSPANNHGLANDGLFQVWRGHSYNANGQVASMSPYQQAILVAQHFDLTPGDIRRYAGEIRNGTYGGWG